MGTKGYHSYRGRRGWQKHLLIGVLVLILLAACTFMFLQRYITYTDDGKLRLDLPFFQREEQTGMPPVQENGGDVNLTIEEPEKPEPVKEPVAADYGPHRLVELTALPADGETLRETLDAAGANGFVFQVKDETGAVHFDSSMAMDDAVQEDAVSGEDLGELCAREDLISVARLNCFHDSYYAWAHMESAGICQETGYIWYDYNSWHWLDPDKEAARQYVIDLALECAQLGFDEILLEEAAYPAGGNLGKIDYSNNILGKTDALKLFLTELKEALKPYDVAVTLLLDGRLLTAEGEALAQNSGQELAALLPLTDAVYAPVSDFSAAEQILAEAAGENEAPPLIPAAEAPGEGGKLVPYGAVTDKPQAAGAGLANAADCGVESRSIFSSL